MIQTVGTTIHETRIEEPSSLSPLLLLFSKAKQSTRERGGVSEGVSNVNPVVILLICH